MWFAIANNMDNQNKKPVGPDGKLCLYQYNEKQCLCGNHPVKNGIGFTSLT